MAQAKAPKKDPLDALANGDPKDVIALMLWKARHREPDMYVQITAKDIEAFQESCTYQKLKPSVLIVHPQGREATPAIPATKNRRATPATPAGPAKPFVMVTLVEEGTENVIRPIENNEGDFDRAQDVATVRRMRDNANQMADLIERGFRSGEQSESDIKDAAEALRTLARALQ